MPDLNKIKGPVTVKELGRLGITPMMIQSLVIANELLPVGRGVYQRSSEDLSDENAFRAATKRIKGKSAVCLLSALALYNLVDEIPKQTWLLVDSGKRTYQKDIRLFRSRNPKWNVGIIKEDGYWITNKERTIVDSILNEKKLGLLGISALKRAIAQKETTLARVMDMAIALKVRDRIYPYIKVLA
jgi:predicted transcriptional regulator of viral defense system